MHPCVLLMCPITRKHLQQFLAQASHSDNGNNFLWAFFLGASNNNAREEVIYRLCWQEGTKMLAVILMGCRLQVAVCQHSSTEHIF